MPQVFHALRSDLQAMLKLSPRVNRPDVRRNGQAHSWSSDHREWFPGTGGNAPGPGGRANNRI